MPDIFRRWTLPPDGKQTVKVKRFPPDVPNRVRPGKAPVVQAISWRLEMNSGSAIAVVGVAPWPWPWLVVRLAGML